jgi:hypothetical protein
MADIKIDIAAEFTGNKAFKKAETTTDKLTNGVKKLAVAFASAFGAQKLAAYGKAAVKAFAADEKAARSLSVALANTGNAFRGIEVEKFIGDLQRATGVLDDNLRPAFRTLLTATGDVTKSQEGLKLALDISAGTGKDLGAVSMALSRAYGGQTTALGRLGAGLSKATLKTGDMDEIIGELTKKFSGQALAAAEGYSGQMDRLTVASENAKEIIGKDLLDAMSLIAGKDGISGATSAMEGFAIEVGNAIYGVGVLISKLRELPGGADLLEGTKDVLSFNIFGLLSRFGASSKARLAGTGQQSPGERKKIDKINADALAIQKKLNALKKIDNDATARKIVLTADQQALEELKKKFDVERVGLFAALNQATDQETQMRLRSLIAIKDNDAALAGKIKAELEAASATAMLAGSLRALSAEFEFERMRMALGKAQMAGVAAATAISPIAGSQAALDTALKLYPDFGSEMDAARSAAGRAQMSNITVNVAGSVTTERDLVSAITQGIYNNQASGIPINYSTSYV